MVQVAMCAHTPRAAGSLFGARSACAPLDSKPRLRGKESALHACMHTMLRVCATDERLPDTAEPFPDADARIGVRRLKSARAHAAGSRLRLILVTPISRRHTASCGGHPAQDARAALTPGRTSWQRSAARVRRRRRVEISPVHPRDKHRRLGADGDGGRGLLRNVPLPAVGRVLPQLLDPLAFVADFLGLAQAPPPALHTPGGHRCLGASRGSRRCAGHPVRTQRMPGLVAGSSNDSRSAATSTATR